LTAGGSGAELSQLFIDALPVLEQDEGSIVFWMTFEAPLGDLPGIRTILETPVADRMHRISISSGLREVDYTESHVGGQLRKVVLDAFPFKGSRGLMVAFTWSVKELTLYVGDIEKRVGLLEASSL
jgi:hypothetical protein